jgi:hypothetical protein
LIQGQRVIVNTRVHRGEWIGDLALVPAAKAKMD